MNSNLNANLTVTKEQIEERYQRAQVLSQGWLAKKVSYNATLIPHWIEDTDFFWYERELESGKEFRLVDAKGNTNELAFDHSELAGALEKISEKNVDPADLPIQKIKLILSPLSVEFTSFDSRWMYLFESQTCTHLEENPREGLVSPDGRKAVFERDNNIWLRDVDSGEERALTHDGEQYFGYGSSPTVLGIKAPADVLDALWSPDSKRLFTLQMDTRKVKTFPMMEYVPELDGPRPKIFAENRRVALCGDANVDEYRFLSIDVETGKQQDAHYSRCPVFRMGFGYFTHGHGWWSRDSRHAYFIDLERYGDHVARLVEFDTQTGSTRVVLKEESPETCFKLKLDSRSPIHARPLVETDEFIWFSERTGWGHLYLYNAKTGALKNAITTGDWVVRETCHYDADRRELIIQTGGRVKDLDPYYRDICRVNIDTGELTPLISSDHEYIVFNEKDELALNLSMARETSGAYGISPTGNYFVTTRSRVDTIPESLLFDRDGNEITLVETATVFGLPQGWQWPERVKLKAADGKTDIYGVIYRPSNFDPNNAYPVLNNAMTSKEGASAYIPAGSFTNSSIAGSRYFEPAALAELGLIVVDIAGRGTTNRSQSFFSCSEPEPELPSSDFLADQVAGIRQLAEQYPYMDLSRVGAGASVSTNIAVGALLGHPDFYKVGVSNAAATASPLYQAINGESYNGLPEAESIRPRTEAYVKNLKGKLLLLHGMLNPAVPVSMSFSLVDALTKANKEFDMLFFPNDGYPVCSYGIRRGWDYLVKHLIGVEPPESFHLKTGSDVWAESFGKISDFTLEETVSEATESY